MPLKELIKEFKAFFNNPAEKKKFFELMKRLADVKTVEGTDPPQKVATLKPATLKQYRLE